VKNGWTNSAKQPVKNKELIQYISSLIASRHDKNQSIHLEYVKGHSGDVGNDGADALAVAGCWKPEIPEKNWVLLEMNLTVDTDVDVDVDFDVRISVIILVAMG
jgi:RNase H